MNWKTELVILLLLLAGGCSQKRSQEVISGQSPIISKYLIDADELVTIAYNPNIKILDFRSAANYKESHIIGALHIKRTDIEDSTFSYGGMMASPKQIESLFSTLGIQSDDTLIIYDDNGLCEAARLWWILQNYEFTNVRLLHGGLNAWASEGGILTSEIPLTKQTQFKLPDSPSMKTHINKDGVQAALNSETIILDTRTQEEYRGMIQKKGAMKAGRIPGSIHIDWANAIDFNGTKELKSYQELEVLYNGLSDKKESPIIVYCHSGVRSAHTTFVLTQLLGYSNVKNYDGSWIEWSRFQELEIEQDSVIMINN